MNSSDATVVTKYFAKIAILFLQCSHAACDMGSLIPGTHKKKQRSAWYTLFVNVFNLRVYGLFSDSSVLCDIGVWNRYSTLVRII